MNNIFTINNNNNNKVNNNNNNKVNNNKVNSLKKKKVLKVIELFSFWITIHFVIYGIFQKILPSWTNPMFWLIYGYSIQIALFILGWNIMPHWFKGSVLVWKSIMLVLGLMYFDYNMSFSAVNFNLLLLLLYILILEVGYNKNIYDVYAGVILSKNYHSITPKRFIMNRIRNII